ncbi:PAS domain S-box protein [Nitrolancea hollandica]|uniref:histidine kinase n=1 Tax=Nitrolancea hollandica Lb TaxID=1129897 RepID=I4ECM3_9BACT|nr:PAS domain S-box protein [Nitrolancea hollandica]CCF82435.1 putative Histidine kinase [Nitrolancea hollandica Lb]
MPRVRPPATQRYSVAIAASALAMLLTYLLSTHLFPEAPFIVWFPVIMISAWYGGLGPGLVATASALVAAVFTLPPPWSLGVDLRDITWLVLYALATLIICLLTAGLTEARRRAEVVQQRYRDLVHDLDAIVWEAEPSSFRFTFVSHGAEELLGYPVSSWLAEPGFWGRLIHSKDRQLVLDECRFPDIGGLSREIEHRAVARNGDLRWFRTTVHRVRNGPSHHLRGLMVDITARKTSEEALARLSHRNRLILHSTGEGICGLDLNGNVTFANPAAGVMIGWEPEELIGRHLHSVLHHTRRDGTPYAAEDCPIYAAFQDGAVHHASGEVFWRKDGSSFPVEFMSTPIWEEGELVGAVMTFLNITEREQAQKTLQANEERLNRIVETIADGILITDSDGRYTFANAAAEKILGLERCRIVGRFVDDLPWETTAPENEPSSREVRAFTRVMRDGEPVYGVELAVLPPGGTPRVISVNATPLRGSDGALAGVLSSFTDVTERRRAEDRMRFLADAGTLLVSSLDYQSMLASLARMVVPGLADICMIDLIGEDQSIQRVAESCGDPETEKLVREIQETKVDSSAEWYRRFQVARTGQPEIVVEIPDSLFISASSDERCLNLLRKLNPRSVMVVPLSARDRTIGAMMFVSRASERRYGPADLALAQDLAFRAALAVDNARLYQEAQRAVRREQDRVTQLRGLADASLAINSAISLDEMLRSITEQARSVIGAHQCVASTSVDVGRTHFVSAASYSEKYAGTGTTDRSPDDWGLSAFVCPVSRPMRMTEADIIRNLPDPCEFGLEPRSNPPLRGWLAAPLIGFEGRVLGLIQLSDKFDGDFTDEDEAIVLQLAQMASVAVENARLYREAEAAQQRLALLAEASTLLVSSLDYATTLSSVACLAVPFLADWCVVHVIEDDGVVRQLALAHAESLGSELAGRLQSNDLAGTQGPHAVIQKVLRTSHSAFFPEISRPMDGLREFEDDLVALHDLGLESLMVVPLVAHGRTLGTMSFAWVNPERRYSAADLALAEDLAHRAALAMDNSRLYGEIRDAVRIRDEFLSTVSHDLKTPLTAIKGRAQLLRRRAGRNDDRSGKDWMTEGLVQIDTTATRMSTLINELLDISRLQIGQPLELDRHPVDLVQLVRQRAEEWRHEDAGQHDIQVETALLSLIGNWDVDRLDRVLSNLLANALKYSPDGGAVTLRLTREESSGEEWAVLDVIDQGIGIPAADLPHIFEPFTRAGNAVGQIAGTGLGLAGAQRIIEQHGGTIQVVSQEGAGSTFTLRLPLTKEGVAIRATHPVRQVHSRPA